MKKEKTVFFKSSLSACALFVLGNGVMVLPDKTADEYTVLGLILAAAVGILLNIALIPAANALCKEKTAQNIFEKILKAVVFLCLAVAALFAAADTFNDFTGFVSKLILPEIPMWIIAATFGAVVVFFSLKRQEDTLKFALIALSFTAVAVVFFFLATSGNFDFENIFVHRMPYGEELLNSIRPYFIKATLPAFLLAFYRGLAFGKKHSAACVLGTGFGYILLCVCVLSSVLLFSPHLAGRLSYPYASAVSTVTVGKLFARLDGFSYFIYFAAAIMKINICTFITVGSLKRLNKLFCGRVDL